MRAKSRFASVLLGVALAVGGYYTGRGAAEGAPTSKPIFYAGVLENEGQSAEGRFTIALQLSAAETGDAELCTSRSENVMVTKGRFRVEVSSSCVAFMRDHTDVWVAVEYVDEAGIKHELPGRTKVGAVPYAMEAEHAKSASQASGALAGQLIPSGMIAMFAASCPPGWSEYTGLRGRVPRGEPEGKAEALDHGGSDDAIVVQHTHGAQAELQTAGAHAHTIRGTVQPAGEHIHIQSVTANPGMCPGSGITREDWNRDTSDLCNYPHVATNPAGAHGHELSLAESTAGEHTHAATVAVGDSGAPGAGANMQAFAEVLFCVKL
jgi:hypothetical protein